jgi:DNA-binding CsgD family transcriptional regulator
LPDIPPYARRQLSPRELEIILLLPAGNAEIARRLTLTVNSVKTHILRIRKKYDLPSRPMLVELAPRILAADAPLPAALTVGAAAVICPHCGSLIDLANPTSQAA